MNCRWYDSRVGGKASNRVRDSDKLTICNCDVMIAEQGCQPNHRNRYLVRLTQTKLQQEIFSSPHTSRSALETTLASREGGGSLSLRQSGRSVALTSHTCLALMLRKSTAITLHTLCACKTCYGETFTLP
jgi:hypothetical protein